MSELKYVVFNGVCGPTMIMFPAFLRHDAFSNMGPLISAGFIGRDASKKSGFCCYGESRSTGLKVHEDDQFLLDSMLSE
jgi:hypothetical protein